MSEIQYYSADIDFKPPNPTKTRKWIRLVVKKEKAVVEGVSFIFCSDEYLLQINQDFLNHTTYTDIITFPEGDSKSIRGEIYISVPRVTENAAKFEVVFETELRRVMIHGILHLLGYLDKSKDQKLEMRRKEDACLSLYSKM